PHSDTHHRWRNWCATTFTSARIPSWATANSDCDLQHRRSWLARYPLQAITVDNGVCPDRIWSAGHEDDRICFGRPVGSCGDRWFCQRSRHQDLLGAAGTPVLLSIFGWAVRASARTAGSSLHGANLVLQTIDGPQVLDRP